MLESIDASISVAQTDVSDFMTGARQERLDGPHLQRLRPLRQGLAESFLCA